MTMSALHDQAAPIELPLRIQHLGAKLGGDGGQGRCAGLHDFASDDVRIHYVYAKLGKLVGNGGFAAANTACDYNDIHGSVHPFFRGQWRDTSG